jgi:hypothetical protein
MNLHSQETPSQPRSRLEKLYLPHDKYVILNANDDVLKPIVLRLPEPPPIQCIDGYGLHPLEQVFTSHIIPPKLAILQERTLRACQEYVDSNKTRRMSDFLVSKEFWHTLDQEKNGFKEEIDYIKKVHWHMYYGYWFFCKGKPTYISPWHYRYLNFWYIDSPATDYKPRYKDIDRRNYLFKHYLYTTKETFVDLDDAGYAVKGPDNKYKMKVLNNRTFFGRIKPKRRREGATNQACNDLTWIAERTKIGHCTIIANTGEAAEGLFKEIFVPAWKNIPIFLKPINSATNDPSEIKLTSPRTEYSDKGINSSIGYTDTAGEGGNDRRKLYGILSDESGKTPAKISDVLKRHETNKLTCCQYENIHGWMDYPSTVEEMNEGGEIYEEIWSQSDFFRRLPSGQTFSGLCRVFNPAYDGQDGYIDWWGYSVIDNPIEDQLERYPSDAGYVSSRKGAKDTIQSEYDVLLKDGSPQSLSLYNMRLRKNPMTSSDCWRGTSGDMGFNTLVIDKRLAELKINSVKLTKGNFKLETGPGGNEYARFYQDDIKGRFLISDLNLGHENQWKMSQTMVYDADTNRNIKAKSPLTPGIFTAGADSFDYLTKDTKVTKSRMSDGGGCVKRNYDNIIDGQLPPEQRQTGRLVCTYRFRPPTELEYLNDMLAMCLWYGAMICPESNKKNLIKHFIDKGYAGYLIYLQNPDGTFKKEPGIWTGTNKDDYFNALRDYIDEYGSYEMHYDFLSEAKGISGPEKLKDYDLLASVACALIGSRSKYTTAINRFSGNKLNVTGTFLARRSI